MLGPMESYDIRPAPVGDRPTMHLPLLYTSVTLRKPDRFFPIDLGTLLSHYDITKANNP